ncbi:MAG: LysM peptidoglycan-binding domain-containing protein [Anaerocolumna sp.]
MIIHVVQSGETINSIADEYGVNVTRLIQDNDITNADNLAIGQTILIVYPKQIHTVQEGDTLISIAGSYGVSTLQLLRNNPYLLERKFIYPGERIIIDYADDKLGNITTNGYAYPYIYKDILQKNLLYLTYLSVFNYVVAVDGGLNNIDDTEIINLAKSYGVAPIMVISNVTEEGTVDREMIHNLLISQEIMNNLIKNILSVLKTKGYYGVNLDIPYVMAEDRQLFFDFIAFIADKVHEEGFKVFITITPNSFEFDTEAGYESFNYSQLGQAADGVIILSYSWGYASEIPIEAAPLNLLVILLEYLLTQIPPEKISIGVSSIGYVWEIPYIQGVSRANSISNTNAVQLASDVGAEINYNESNLSSYFFITDSNEYLVYFHDIRSIDTSMRTMSENKLQGADIWNIMYFLTQTFFLINTQYNIEKVI